MGYNTDFEGEIYIVPALPDEVVERANVFCEERHEGPGTPGYWCDYEFQNIDGETRMYWNGNEKSYDMDEWAQVLIDKFVKPHGSVANGSLEAYGEGPGDIWRLHVEDNKVRRQTASISWE